MPGRWAADAHAALSPSARSAEPSRPEPGRYGDLEWRLQSTPRSRCAGVGTCCCGDAALRRSLPGAARDLGLRSLKPKSVRCTHSARSILRKLERAWNCVGVSARWLGGRVAAHAHTLERCAWTSHTPAPLVASTGTLDHWVGRCGRLACILRACCRRHPARGRVPFAAGPHPPSYTGTGGAGAGCSVMMR